MHSVLSAFRNSERTGYSHINRNSVTFGSEQPQGIPAKVSSDANTLEQRKAAIIRVPLVNKSNFGVPQSEIGALRRMKAEAAIDQACKPNVSFKGLLDKGVPVADYAGKRTVAAAKASVHRAKRAKQSISYRNVIFGDALDAFVRAARRSMSKVAKHARGHVYA